MLKQSPSRTLRAKRFKVKHVLQMCLLIAVCIWLLNQLKHSYDKKAPYQHDAGDISGKAQSDVEFLKLGRKDLLPRADKVDQEEDFDEIKPEELEDEGRGGGDDEIDGHDQERVDEEENEEVEDLIDADDREREDANEQQEIEERSEQLQGGSTRVNQYQNNGQSNFEGERVEQSKGDDESNYALPGIKTVGAEQLAGSMRKMLVKEYENMEYNIKKRRPERSASRSSTFSFSGQTNN